LDGGEPAREGDGAPEPDAAPAADDALPQNVEDDLNARMAHLLDAITQDEARLASDALFPRDAWVASRDSADPGKEWERRVASPFRRAVHRLSKSPNFGRAHFVRFELGRDLSQEPMRKRGWKKALWTVKGSSITLDVAGRMHRIPIREMTAWRGAWYITRLR
jgi:hypothetical protein